MKRITGNTWLRRTWILSVFLIGTSIGIDLWSPSWSRASVWRRFHAAL